MKNENATYEFAAWLFRKIQWEKQKIFFEKSFLKCFCFL